MAGPSGSGKSTLLHMLGAMDRPTRGEVLVADQRVNRLSQRELTRFRRQTVGFVFQTFNLVPNLTALENIALPMEFNGVPKAARLERAKALLERFQLAHRERHRPSELSGGEMQRCGAAGRGFVRGSLPRLQESAWHPKGAADLWLRSCQLDVPLWRLHVARRVF
jgi:ABC-type lipoprotein export system ATPase subunit